MKALTVPMSNGGQKQTDVFRFVKGELDVQDHLNEAFAAVQTQIQDCATGGEALSDHNTDGEAHWDIRGELEDVKAVAAAGMPQAGGAFAGAVVAANTADGSAQLRNILVADEAPTELETGVVCFVYE